MEYWKNPADKVHALLRSYWDGRNANGELENRKIASLRKYMHYYACPAENRTEKFCGFLKESRFLRLSNIIICNHGKYMVLHWLKL